VSSPAGIVWLLVSYLFILVSWNWTALQHVEWSTDTGIPCGTQSLANVTQTSYSRPPCRHGAVVGTELATQSRGLSCSQKEVDLKTRVQNCISLINAAWLVDAEELPPAVFFWTGTSVSQQLGEQPVERAPKAFEYWYGAVDESKEPNYRENESVYLVGMLKWSGEHWDSSKEEGKGTGIFNHWATFPGCIGEMKEVGYVVDDYRPKPIHIIVNDNLKR